jgi:2-oxoglutarate dehydrogenase E2 component (dihydrolipoamide succinyltransferase)
MIIEVQVPQLSESVAEATLSTWHVKEGDAVARDQNLIDIETDKVVLELPAPGAGVIVKIIKGNGESVASGEVIAHIDTEAKASAAAPAAAKPAAAPAAAPAPAASATAMPAARKIMDEKGIAAADVQGSGRGGRILKEDVSGAAKPAPAAPVAVSPAPTSAAKPALPQPNVVNADAIIADRPEQRVPMTRLRARIAERLVEAQQTAAMLTTFNEVDLAAVSALRARYKDRFEKEHGVKLGFMAFFVRATIEALKRHPVVNASIEGTDIVYHDYYDVGIAVSTDRGLIVPILRDADRLSFAGVEGAIAEYGRKARDGNLSMDDLTGGTFTITNGGVFGSLLSTPILNPPQSGILGMHKIQERPTVVDGQVVARPMMYIALSYDHRIIDGRDAVQFLVAIKEALEDPARLLLGV